MSLLTKNEAKDYPINLVIKLDKPNRPSRKSPVRKGKYGWEKTLKY